MQRLITPLLIILGLTSFVIDKGDNNVLGWIEFNQELTLTHENEKCGEWGGDVVKITVYRKDLNGQFVARIEKTIIDCSDPDGLRSKPKNIKWNEALLSTEEQRLVNRCVEELRKMKMTVDASNYPIVGHSGVVNVAMLSDSTLLLKDYPSREWKSFEVLKKALMKK